MLLVCISFIVANIFPQSAAFLLWSKSAESLMAFMGLGVGMKMTKDVAESYISRKNRVDNPDA